jgi:hypothetical protein
MKWDIPKYESPSGDSYDVGNGDPEPDATDLELGDSFLIHIQDADKIDRYYWVHGGLPLKEYRYDIEAAVEALIKQLANRYGFRV